MRRSFPVTTRIAAAVAVIVGFALISNGGAARDIRKLGNELEGATRRTARALTMAEDIRTAIYEMRFAQRGISLALLEAPQDLPKAEKLFHDSGGRIENLLNDLPPLLDSPRDTVLVATMREKIRKWRALGPEMERLAAAGDTPGLSRLRTGEVRKTADEIDAAAKDLIAHGTDALAQAESRAAATVWNAFAMQMAFALGLLLAGGVAMLWTRRTGKHIQQLAANLRMGARHLADAASHVKTVGMSLADGSTQQASSLEETSACTEEFHAMTRSNLDNAAKAANVMADVDRQMQTGAAALGDMVTSMQLISESSSRISKIIGAIDEIAFQTNILALNAAVEAARAGQAGLGFAVVADEVRNLAGRCSQAAKDTASLIDQSVERSRQGSLKLENLAELIKGLVGGSANVKGLVDEVRRASEEQARGMEQISKALLNIEQVTQKTASVAADGATAGNAMSDESLDLVRHADELDRLFGAGGAE